MLRLITPLFAPRLLIADLMLHLPWLTRSRRYCHVVAVAPYAIFCQAFHTLLILLPELLPLSRHAAAAELLPHFHALRCCLRCRLAFVSAP